MNNLFGKLKKYLLLCIIYFFNCFPIKSNKIFMFSYYGSQYGCNPKYITEYIIQNISKERFDIVWAFNDLNKRDHIPVRKVKTMSLKYYYELCTSKVVITNFRTTDLFIKRKNQYYIQTWHSSLRLKQIEKDAERNLPEDYIKMAKRDSEKCDLLLSGCKYSTDIFKKSFWYEGEIFEFGTPRNDLLFHENPQKKIEILKKLNVPSDFKIILHAPTFRNDGNLAVYDLNYCGLLKSLEKKMGGKWICLVKLHPHLILKSSQLVYGDNVLDVTNYNDIQELLSISDALITDYSSLMFDFSITHKPCFLYIPDFKDYVKNDRKLYFDLMELPFKTAMDYSDLLNEIELFEPEKYTKDLICFFEKIGSYENGRASESLVKRINEVCFNKNRRELNEAL